MRIWEEDGCWIEENYVLAMHTPVGVKYPIKMLKKFINVVKDKTEAMVLIPREDIFNLFNKHYDLTFINDTVNGKLYLAKHKE